MYEEPMLLEGVVLIATGMSLSLLQVFEHIASEGLVREKSLVSS